MQSAPALVAAPVNPNPLVSGLSNEESPTAHKKTKLLDWKEFLDIKTLEASKKKQLILS